MKYMFVFPLMLFLLLSNSYASAQTKPCVFCEIAAGQIDRSRVVYHDSTVAAFLSHGPDNPGHLLVVPVAHARELTDIPQTTACNMMRVANLLVNAVKKTAIEAEAFRLMMNSGRAAGQSVMHAHLHIIPRYTGETLNLNHTIAPAEELDAVAEMIRKALN